MSKTIGETNAKEAKVNKLEDGLGGLDVRIQSKDLEPDKWAANMINEVGKTLAPNGMSYEGSFVTHIYSSTLARELAFMHQIKLNDVSEAVASNAVKDLSIRLRKYFNPSWKYKTLDQRDKRT